MHRETVFIIDDDSSVRDALMLLLSLRGHACAAFASAEDFLAALQPGWRGCVVADIRMSGMSGLQLQAMLREQGLPLPVIVITAHGDVAAARQAFMADAVDFLEKPFDSDALFDRIQKAFAFDAAYRRREADYAALQDRIDQLTERDRQTLDLLLAGDSNKSMATAALGMQPCWHCWLPRFCPPHLLRLGLRRSKCRPHCSRHP